MLLDRIRYSHFPFRSSESNQVVHFISLFLLWFLAVLFIGNEVRAQNTKNPSESIAFASDLAHGAYQSFEKGDFQKALPLARQSLQVREEFLDVNHLDIANSANILGKIQLALLDLVEAETLFERSLKIRERQLGPSHPLVAESLSFLGRVYTEQGNFDKALAVLTRSLEIRQKVLNKHHPDLGVTLTYLAQLQELMGDLANAQKGYTQAVAIFSFEPLSRPGEHGWALAGLGQLKERIGDVSAAREILEESLSIREQGLGPTHPYVARTYAHIARIMLNSGEAESVPPLLQRVLEIDTASYGENHLAMVPHLKILGDVYLELQETTKAREIYEQALSIEQQFLGKNHYRVAEMLIRIARAYIIQKNLIQALDRIEEAIHIQEKSVGSQSIFLAASLSLKAWVLASQRQYDQSDPLFKRALEIQERHLTPNHPDIVLSLTNLGRLYHAQKKFEHARFYYEKARQGLTQNFSTFANLSDRALRNSWKNQVRGLKTYLRALVALAEHSPKDHTVLVDAFLVAEQARGWVVQHAVARAMARTKVQNANQANLVRRIEELRRRRQDIWNQLNVFYGTTGEKVVPDRIDTLKTELQNLEGTLHKKTVKLELEFPNYSELALPRPIELETIRESLNPHEALVSYYLLKRRLLIWVIRSDTPPYFVSVPIEKDKLDGLIAQVRGSMNPSYAAFHVKSAFELHKILLAPIQQHLSGVTQLFLVPDEALLSLPFAALVTDNAGIAYQEAKKTFELAKNADPLRPSFYEGISWLAKRYALTVLPSASILRFLRNDKNVRLNAATPLLGFGDPDLQGNGTQRGGPMIPLGIRGAIRDQIKSLNRLPGTRKELQAVATALHADLQQSVFLGKQATELMVRKLNTSGKLGDSAVLYFATHGLLAGELQGILQPSLVLTPPATETSDEDGLLTMEEILQLKLLKTFWVVLSACNTGGSDGSGEGLSGLARAFFYAGAKSLLVSQWSVDDFATQELMTQVFQTYGKEQNIAPAQALQQGMLKLIELSKRDGLQRLAHPYAWASFMLVGEGGSFIMGNRNKEPATEF